MPQALSLAEGLAPQSAPKKARIFRPRMNSQQRDEVSVNIADILAGKIPDPELRAGTILFVPNSAAKKLGYRAAEAALQTVTGIAIWRM